MKNHVTNSNTKSSLETKFFCFGKAEGMLLPDGCIVTLCATIVQRIEQKLLWLARKHC